MNGKVFRPSLDDVERLSFGKGARKRGTGSRHVCHRLNQEERKLYEFAKQAGYLTVKGTGYRKERKGSPVCNTFRQRCDALEQVCVVVEKRAVEDTVVIDFSTLRVRDDAPFMALILEKVLKPKYPDLYAHVVERGNKDASKKIVLSSTPIDWEVVTSRPIWGVKERLLTVHCERVVAKALALDVLKESTNFHQIDPIALAIEAQNQDTSSKAIDTAVSDGEDAYADIIDWNDI